MTIAATDPSAAEAGPDTGTFTLTRAGNTALALVITFTRDGTATNASDYASLGTTTTIPAGQASVAITVTPVNDSVVEAPETVILTLVDGAHYDLGAQTSATVTIASDE